MLRDAQKTIGTLIDSQKTCLLSSVDADGFPNTRAMLQPRKRDGIRTILFSTNTSSQHVAQFRENPKACVYTYDRRFFRGAMLLGTIEVLEDAEHKELLWERGDTMYYPKGVTDPDYCVLRFTALRGRYYSNFKSESFDVE